MTRKKIIFREEKPASRKELAAFGKVKHIFKEEERVLNVLQLIIYAMGVVVTLLGIAMISVVLTSCSIIDEDTSDCPKDSTQAGSRSGSAIVFSVGDSTACTKGTVLSVSDAPWNGSTPGTLVLGGTRTAEGTMTLDGSGAHEQSLKTQGFGVFASHTGVHPYVSTSTAINLMHNRHVTYDNGLGVWTYSPLAYWPNGEDGADQLVTFSPTRPTATMPAVALPTCRVPTNSATPG